MASSRTSSPRPRRTTGKNTTRPPRGPVDPALTLFDLDTVTGGGSKKIGDRYYQVEAVQAIGRGLLHGGRGQLRSACGTGKTVMCQRAAELLCPPGGVVVITCPSIALVAQTLREWTAVAADHTALAVCSDGTIVEEDSAVSVADLTSPVTTDPQQVAAWLRRPTTAAIRLIVGTHVSSDVIGDGLLAAGRKADLLIVDEAHRTAGRVDKHSALMHDDTRLPAVRRLYATATPRVVRTIDEDEHARSLRRNRVLDMADEAVFGPVLYNYSFSQAIEDGYLENYRLAVMGVTEAEIMHYLGDLPRNAITGGMSVSLHTAMVQTVLARAAAQFDLRRVLVFGNRLNEAVEFSRSMNLTLSYLPPDAKPARRLHTAHVNGGMPSSERERYLDLLRDPPEDGWTVVSNVRCLAEGVDVPAIDSVVFTHPKKSVAEIIQAIGRALRPTPDGSGTATILVPVLLPDDPEDYDPSVLSDYKLLYDVVRALRAQDDVFGATLDHMGPGGGGRFDYDLEPLEHVQISLPEGYDDSKFLRQLSVRIVAAGRDRWWERFALLKAFLNEFGHVDVTPDHVCEDGYKLGKWVSDVRLAYRQGRLNEDRVTALAGIGFDLAPAAAEWAVGIRAARAFHADTGHLEPVRSQKIRGVELRAWLDRQRALGASGELPSRRREALDALGMRWASEPVTFDDYIQALTEHHARHGTIDIPPDPTTPEGRLGSWLVSIRIQYRRRHLDEGQVACLDALGMRWTALPPALPRRH